MSDNCSYIDGIGSSTAIDTAGEIVDLAGIDCSTLVGAPFNFEHKSDLPAQIVGKVLEYKKIFSENDCENDRHKLFWEKCKTPFLYVMGRLFDDKKESSKEIAALFIDDMEHPDEQPMVGFSIEGSKVDKKGIVVTKSIARKITITNLPANKTCVAELVPSANPKQKDNDSIFKSESTICIELFHKAETLTKAAVPGSKYPSQAMNPMGQKMETAGVPKFAPIAPKPPKPTMDVAKPAASIMKAAVPGSKYPSAADAKHKPSSGAAPKFGPIETKPRDLGQKIGSTKSGKSVMSHAMPHDYRGFSAQDHLDAAGLHHGHAEQGKGIKGANHFDTAKRHMSVSGRGERQEATAAAKRTKALNRPDLNTSRMKKSLTAGSGLASPGSLEGGAALAKESLEKKAQKLSKWLKRAEEEYQSWSKREEFEDFMTKSMPHLTKGEVKAFGKTMCLSKSLKAEKKLEKLMVGGNTSSFLNKKIKR